MRACSRRRARGPLSGSRRCGSSRRCLRRPRAVTATATKASVAAAAVLGGPGRGLALTLGRIQRMRSLRCPTKRPRPATAAEAGTAASRTETSLAPAEPTTPHAMAVAIAVARSWATSPSRRRRRRRRRRMRPLALRPAELACGRWRCSTWPGGMRCAPMQSRPGRRPQDGQGRPRPGREALVVRPQLPLRLAMWMTTRPPAPAPGWTPPRRLPRRLAQSALPHLQARPRSSRCVTPSCRQGHRQWLPRRLRRQRQRPHQRERQRPHQLRQRFPQRARTRMGTSLKASQRFCRPSTTGM